MFVPSLKTGIFPPLQFAHLGVGREGVGREPKEQVYEFKYCFCYEHVVLRFLSNAQTGTAQNEAQFHNIQRLKLSRINRSHRKREIRFLHGLELNINTALSIHKAICPDIR